VAAEARLRAANAGVGVALSEYYPKVSLSALLGAESIRSGALFSPASQESQAALGLRWRLFDFGRIDAELAAARGARAEALAAWRMSVLVAAEDVENALVARAEDRTRTDALARAQAAVVAARADTQRAYGEGVVSLLDLRRADRDVLGASDRLLQSQSDLARATVRVFRALGRG
jgi:outer membrane protein TolC